MSCEMLFARQPVFDRQLETFAYNLRIAHPDLPLLEQPPEPDVCNDLLLDTCCSILDQGQLRILPAIITISLDWLRTYVVPSVMPNRLVLELVLSEMDRVTADDLKYLKQLNDRGYRLVVAVDAPRHVRALADLIKLDLTRFSLQALEKHARTLLAMDADLLVTGINNYADYEACSALEVPLFQGSFFARPRPVNGRRLSLQETVMLQLIAEAHDPETSPQTLEELIKRDPSLVVGLLKLVNSAVFRGHRQISSIQEAIILLGMNELRKWLLLFSVSRYQNKPQELMRLLLIKARMCEQLAQESRSVEPSTAFLAGVISGLDALLDIERDELMPQLPIALEVKRALNGGNGDLGALLSRVTAYCDGVWSALSAEEREAYRPIHEEALHWCNQVVGCL
ncbi:EAL and HDOD domain-containing protein [Pontibacter sp. JAM-7]|uniref:EAL and HDOD domain-containing protein n=1 Tax=Pontibacter sp. JAM-7 TaxID=3366581 RepID=UPI003AF44941